MAIVTNLEALNRDVTEIMLRHYGDRLAKIILFGSYARGDFHDDSDVDYLVVLTDDSVSSFREVSTTAADRNAYYLKNFVHISAVVVSDKQYTSSNRIFYREVRKDGKPIYERGFKPLHQESKRILS